MDTISMYIKKIKIKNIRGFGETEVNFENKDGILPQWTIILGDNGIGKSTILQSVAWMKPFLPIMKDDDKEYGDTELIPAPIINDEENEVLLNLVRKVPKSYDEGAYIEALFKADEKLNCKNHAESDACLTKMNIKLDSDGELSIVDPHLELIPESSVMFHNDEVLIYAYSASRRLGKANLEGIELLDTIPSFITDQTVLYDAQELIHTINYATLDSKGAEKEKYEKFLKSVKSMLVALMPDFDRIEDIKILAPKLVSNKLKPAEFIITTKHGEKIPFENFSLGYKTVLSWVVDLAWRLFNKYSESEFPLYEPAIVLIDEIDLHLHPIWQTSIIRKLSDTFRNVQFIATAHSPLIVQSDMDANLVVLKYINENVITINDPTIVKGWRIGQILTSELFDLKSERGPEVNSLIEERRRILDQMEKTKSDDKRLEELDAELDSLPFLDIENQKLLDNIKEMNEMLKSKLANYDSN